MSSPRSTFDYWVARVRVAAWQRHSLVLTPDIALMQALFERGTPIAAAADELCRVFESGEAAMPHLYRNSGDRFPRC
jgi:hypothetical protein